ncbi:hypothetical protein [Nocardioides lianchengensis]|uniref:Uncharacterized protein n=1 Tax=Nocardioides lianchengensis TaxID=1045774 RepID=A0A1G6TLZ8_9ACTN|nr:hypothetical protein [Nocardioides lianchengensis]NYG11728.1 hypothetical protein [Nocardioides lianchengensis]SDD29437.1 hypothetical protein SAMN05421872_107106 [Nocardioides lianchengensis]
MTDEPLDAEGGATSPAVDWAGLLLERIVQEEVADLDRPHLVMSRHVATGITSYRGPYRDALAAVVAAQEEQIASQRHGQEEGMVFSVAPLFAAHLDQSSESGG